MSENQQASPEEMEKRKKELIDFYTDQIPVLQLRKEYEELQTKIQELQTKKAYAQAQLAQLLYKDKPEEDGDSKSGE